MTPAQRLNVDVEARVRPLEDKLELKGEHVAAIDQLVEQACRKTGESPERCRPFVERAVLERGIEKVREELQ